MRKIYGIGETVFDIIFKDGQPKAGKPGGSVLNSLVSIGRLGLPVSFISEYGRDNVGKIIDSFLDGNGVDSSYVHKFSDGSTSLALAFLDSNNDATYNFYKDFPSERLDINFPAVRDNDIVQCGSFYAIWPEIREKFKAFISGAVKNGALIFYDPNFRKTHLSDLNILKPMILENLSLSSVVRGSDEDFINIFGAADADEAWESVREYCGCLIYTSGTKGVWVKTNAFSGKFPVVSIDPVSTIGAGDNFNAGIISSLYRMGVGRNDLGALDNEQWEKIVAAGVAFATHVCLSYENYISEEFAKNVSQ
jgi:fructokinase